MSVVVVAEKPSVARDLARVLGANERGEGFLRGGGYVVTWAIGHLVHLAEPPEIRPEWKRWARETLPLLPETWPLVVAPETRAQYEVVARLLRAPETAEVVCATDAGREGELIFRYLQTAAGCSKPVRRLWISSLTPEAIRRGFAALRPLSDFDPLAESAHGRARADWLVGMNLTRAATLVHGELFSVGRVQTPTLALLVEREKAIRAFVPEDYFEVVAHFAPPAGEGGAYRGVWFRGEGPTVETRRLPADGAEAAAVVERVRKGRAEVLSVSAETRRLPPPLLYDLTDLQRHANRLHGLSARQTLAAAQALYERHKLITYPRTDSRHLSSDIARGMPAVVKAVAAPYATALAPGTGERPLGRRFVDDTRVSDHHAIVPTTVSSAGRELSSDEARVYDLVCRRLLMAWHDDHVFCVTSVMTRVDSAAHQDRFASSGTVIEAAGWKVLEPPSPKKPARDESPHADEAGQDLPPGLRPGLGRRVAGVERAAKKTRPPRRFTDATLLTAMETAGASLDDRELAAAMKAHGLGTPATRAEIIETLLRRQYIERQGRALAATETGVRLIDGIHPLVKSPALTAEWEAELERVRGGELPLSDFMKRIEAFVCKLVGETLAGPPVPAPAERTPSTPPELPAPPRSSREGTSPALQPLLARFGLSVFRPHQEAVCAAVTSGNDVLLVMPTGAGKSLCYQLPGLARGGTTLVVSPLIALMEDQVGKLRTQGLRAERIHSGRDRSESREVCRAYLEGRLDFLFIAPERLRVPGFPEMLARRPLALVAVDEAHCISEWGHDFRPDYRLLGERLPALRPAPIVALTATATLRVQRDIAEQLALRSPRRFIHGFRRTNIGIEVAGVRPGGPRSLAVLTLLRDPARRPAIVYAPTRKGAEELAAVLQTDGCRSAPYHAGLAAAARERAQGAFLAGELEVVVATIAFGMGVDKPDVRTVVHTGLPSSVEGYYQEIGRAGRDGRPARAVLLYSYADRKTHDFFLSRDYPEPEVLEKVFRALGRDPLPVSDLPRRARLAAEEVEAALDKLWIHGGAIVEGETARAGRSGWRLPYERQREHKKVQLDEMLRFAESHSCRMVSLLRHFGDDDDSRACAQCDTCDPSSALVRSWRQPRPREARTLRSVLGALIERDGQSAGQLHRSCGEGLERRDFENLLGGLARAGLIRASRESFEKDGRVIPYQRVSLTRQGRQAGAPELEAVPLEDDTGHETTSRRRLAGSRSGSRASSPGPRTRAGGRRSDPTARQDPVHDPLYEALREWRRQEARRRGVPAFRILGDRTLAALARERPSSEQELAEVPGLGPKLLARHGAQVLRVIASRPRS